MIRYFVAISIITVGVPAAFGGITFDGIVDSVLLSREDIGGGLDAIVITIDVGADTFTTLDGGFVPLGTSSFHQENLGGADATPASALFSADLLAVSDSTFLLSRDFGDPDIDAANVDTVSELSSSSIAYTSGLTGSFDLARIVVPNGGHFAVTGGGTTSNSIPLISSGAIVGSISGNTVAVPEPSPLLCLLTICAALGIRQRWRKLGIDEEP